MPVQLQTMDGKPAVAGPYNHTGRPDEEASTFDTVDEAAITAAWIRGDQEATGAEPQSLKIVHLVAIEVG